MVPVTGSGTDITSSIKEMEILGKCDSPFIVAYYGAYYDQDHLWLVMEFCEAGEHYFFNIRTLGPSMDKLQHF